MGHGGGKQAGLFIRAAGCSLRLFHSYCTNLIKYHADGCKVLGDFKIFED